MLGHGIGRSRPFEDRSEDGGALRFEDRAVVVRELVKSYGATSAVAGISFEIHRGEILAILGPNGAGKTTTVEILEGYRPPTSGYVRVLGFDPARQRAALKQRIGIILQFTGLEPYLTVRETVEMFAGFYSRPRPVGEVLDLVGLSEKQNERVLRLSGGQQRRMDMAVGLVGDPELLFLDEPTTGFDPNARREAWEVVKSLASLGKTVVLTTHFMDEAQYLAHRVVVLSAGKIIAEGPPSTLGLRAKSDAKIRFRLPVGMSPPAGFTSTVSGDGLVELTVANAAAGAFQVLSWANSLGIELEGFEVRRPSLEDVYLSLTEASANVGERRSGSGS